MKTKRWLGLFLCLLFCLCIFPVFSYADTSGQCGDNLSWSYNASTGTLTITGSGAMYNSQPWSAVRDQIISVSLPSELTTIGERAFSRCTGISFITIPSKPMALHDIREVRIPIELDKPRTLLFDLNAFAELEDKFGSLDKAFQKMQQGSVKATRTLLWAGLLHEDENLTERQVGAMISLTNVETIMEQITNALTAALPEDTDNPENAVAPDPR